ncbi:hypothetical protein [Eudoraea adriatica]|uniref:hypothetical protein n=1 Tax=Eudoraea adriatica TaxID=446681 RepID=UPI00037C63D6|nr:hypothetical protein [Eudoraea adriatica]
MLLTIQTSFPKILLVGLTLLSCTTFYAQKEINKPAPFVRVYDLNGKKTSKGRIIEITDSSLVVSRGEKPVSIELGKIGFIKTKRSAGNNILWGAGIGVSTGLIAGAIEGESEGYFGTTIPAEENIITAAIVMMPFGAAIGAITVLFKKSNTYPIAGDPTIWQAFKKAMQEE